ncbi:hypothetical protein RCH09_003489 [Actimicrobium sp. GrIS 1.19]|uniref:hypothetical protein n=1 Tax=Actimicrobium sp. GrIS 1.19 TaxID=3071708 RepID=UPI002E026B07|nr:hypothetical protein [Actimicrobium sp. GrIS 1.19]
MKNKLIAACSALLLAACVSTPNLPPRPTSTRTPELAPTAVVPADKPSQQISELLVFQSGVRQMKPAELTRALAEADAQPVSSVGIVRRAMLLAAQRGSGDLVRAQALLDVIEVPLTPDGIALKALAQFLSATYGDARRQEEAQDKLTVQLREAQRRNDQLAEKLDALRNIERALAVRPPVPASPPK